MGRACGMYGKHVYKGFWWGDLRERDHLEDIGIDGSRPVFTHGPPGPGPRAANFQGRHIKKIEIEVWYG